MRRRVVRRVLIGVGLALIATPVISFAVTAIYWSQRADYGWAPPIDQPTFTKNHPRVVVDQAHGNASTIDYWGRYWPFGKLLRADGYDVRKGSVSFSAGSFKDVDVLVIANASGASIPQAFGINLPALSGKRADRSDPAFTPAEIDAISDWVEAGGSLLLIADHAPFGESAAALGEAFGVRMFKGFVEVPGEVSDPLVYSRDTGRLGDHPIITGSGPASRVERVATFTGQSLEGPPSATTLLRLPYTAIEYVPTDRQGVFDSVPAGPAQGLALEIGDGRVVVIGEAAMFTAQVHDRKPFGLSATEYDNVQFARNVMRWLSREL